MIFREMVGKFETREELNFLSPGSLAKETARISDETVALFAFDTDARQKLSRNFASRKSVAALLIRSTSKNLPIAQGSCDVLISCLDIAAEQ